MSSTKIEYKCFTDIKDDSAQPRAISISIMASASNQNDLTTRDQPYQLTHTPVHHPHKQVKAMTNSRRTQQILGWTTTYEGTGRSLSNPCF